MRVGILGGGQLGRMLAMAAHRLGLTPVIYAPGPGCASAATDQSELHAWDDLAALDAFAESVDVCTFEVEHVPLEVVERVAARVAFHPNPSALIPTRDRLLEKRLLNNAGIPTAPYVDLVDEAAARGIGDVVGFPALVKLRTGGYDGKGMVKVESGEQAVMAMRELDAPCIAEGWVPWRRELSIVAARTGDDVVAFYAPAENTHVEGILRHSRVPAPDLSDADRQLLEGHTRRLVEQMDYVGVIAIEWFETTEGFVANEIAPRVHNSGHWTLDGAHCSQFENHIRAITGLPLGDTGGTGPSAMVNVIGRVPSLSALLALPRVAPHLYGKSARPGRKIGHVNLTADSVAELDELLGRTRALIEAASE